jgi:hypothetical protein
LPANQADLQTNPLAACNMKEAGRYWIGRPFCPGPFNG